MKSGEMEHEMTLFHTMGLIEIFCSRHTSFFWSDMVSMVTRWCWSIRMCHWLRDITLSSIGIYINVPSVLFTTLREKVGSNTVLITAFPTGRVPFYVCIWRAVDITSIPSCAGKIQTSFWSHAVYLSNTHHNILLPLNRAFWLRLNWTLVVQNLKLHLIELWLSIKCYFDWKVLFT